MTKYHFSTFKPSYLHLELLEHKMKNSQRNDMVRMGKTRNVYIIL